MKRNKQIGCVSILFFLAFVALLVTTFTAKAVEAYNLSWVSQLGTSGDDRSQSVAVDGHGNVCISGYTDGSLGGPNAGIYDAFLAKYNPSGILLWKRQLGTK